MPLLADILLQPIAEVIRDRAARVRPTTVVDGLCLHPRQQMTGDRLIGPHPDHRRITAVGPMASQPRITVADRTDALHLPMTAVPTAVQRPTTAADRTAG